MRHKIVCRASYDPRILIVPKKKVIAARNLKIGPRLPLKKNGKKSKTKCAFLNIGACGHIYSGMRIHIS